MKENKSQTRLPRSIDLQDNNYTITEHKHLFSEVDYNKQAINKKNNIKTKLIQEL